MKRITLDGDDRDFIDYRDGSGGTIEVFDIQVNSERRAGRGRKLMEKLFKLCKGSDVKTVWAITRADNWIAQEFYEKLVFRVVGTLRDFYGVLNEDGKRTVDAILYGRSPKGPV